MKVYAQYGAYFPFGYMYSVLDIVNDGAQPYRQIELFNLAKPIIP